MPTPKKTLVEYVWLDGQKPTAQLRSKTKVIGRPVTKLKDIPEWGFDGSSTEQAEGKFSDCRLTPAFLVPDPIRGAPHKIALCEVYEAGGAPHSTNTRAKLRVAVEKFKKHDAWFGIEQEYTLFKDGAPLGFPPKGYPRPQGPYYCGVGAEQAIGRELIERHMRACLDAGLALYGINAEVMPGQWEFQIGTTGPLEVSDHLWIARWLLHRLAEEYGISVSFAPKPVKGDWNGAGAHTNFSIRSMRAVGGMAIVKAACERLKKKHHEHIAVYGAGNEERLTGKHETANINEFRYGISDRGASIRIPMATADAKAGYLEDRRPAANMDPYQVVAVIMNTVCGS